MTREPPPLVEARGITKRYGPTVALRDAGIAVRTGASHGLVGRNGAGKSTLVAILTGLERPDAGTVAYDGEPAPAPADRAAWDRRVACVHQRSMVIGELTVAENLFLGRRPVTSRGLPVSWRRLRREARALLDTWGVPVPENALARVLSVEDAKMVEIARALSRGTRFIILDEPTAQLDGRAAARLFGHMRRLQDAGVRACVISPVGSACGVRGHLPAVAGGACDRKAPERPRGGATWALRQRGERACQASHARPGI
ncbi:hypothetical protein GCM10022420_087080 [Streptomyces iranensis]|uniref:ABC-type sugar transport system ATPase subunit n=1 Tax=Streptomyces iranensis TaxID=576784 RepID=A0A061A1W1_9ACTN|nr:ABC-type sugar transport system ATPase subunit [Streptomyces iranensis]CDR15789.1 sugar ABC transporter, ATP-binding protein [Streptomyces iranensis]